jgi:hypothetical protein
MIAKFKKTFALLGDIRSRFGMAAALQTMGYRFFNKFMFVERLHIILLTRENVRPLKPNPGAVLSSRLATLEDLEALRADDRWEIDDNKMRYFRCGDSCVLSYADGKLAGYTWAHTGGMPELLPGLTIQVPKEFLYNYSGLTLPEFRGFGLQPYRHHVLLNHEHWQGCKGLLGFVRHTNWSSRQGQGKSGYRKIGAIWMIGWSEYRYFTLFSKSLRSLGVRRIVRQPNSMTNKAVADPP